MMMKRHWLWLYLFLLHLGLLFVLAKPDLILRWRNQLLGRSSEVPAWHADLHGFYQRQDQQVAPGRIVFLGDSHVQSLAVNTISADAINYGIGGDTSAALLRRVTDYRALNSARAIVVVIGSNDLSRRDNAAIVANVRKLLAQWPTVPVLLSTVLPVDDRANPRLQSRLSRLPELAADYAAACAERANCQLLDSFRLFADSEGRLAPNWHEGDGIHLSVEGYARWRTEISQALHTMQMATAP